MLGWDRIRRRWEALENLIDSDRITTKRGTTHAATVHTWGDDTWTAGPSLRTGMRPNCGSKATGTPQALDGGNPVSCKACLRKLRRRS